jgi:uncharacterized protein YceK
MRAKYFFLGVIVLAALSVMTALAGCGSINDLDKPATLAEFKKALQAKNGGSGPSDPVDIAYAGCGRVHDLYVILAEVSKFVNLDLSESSVSGFENSAYPSGSSMILSLILPDNLAYIGDRAFYEWDRLAVVTIPSGVRVIGDYAFSGCSALVRVTIPSGVISIGDGAFSSCNALISVTFAGNAATVAGDSAFPSGVNLRAAAGGSGAGAYQPMAGTYTRNNATWWKN